MNGPISLIAGAVAFVAAYSVFDTGWELTEAKPVGLEIGEVFYFERDGKGYVTQRINSRSGTGLPADWAVEISEINGLATRQICAGGGSGNYNGDTDTYSIDDWVFDDCPDRLTSQHRAEASWTYINANGLRNTISVVIWGGDSTEKENG